MGGVPQRRGPLHERCVDLFERPDGTFGFEEFRRDFEDQGRWTAISYYSGKTYPTRNGDSARVICVDASGLFPVVALIEDKHPRMYAADGWCLPRAIPATSPDG